MPKAYSLDLRERAVSRVLAGEPVRSVASVFAVSVSSVVKWSQRYRATGSVTPGRSGGRRRPASCLAPGADRQRRGTVTDIPSSIPERSMSMKGQEAKPAPTTAVVPVAT
ncbi:unnamed protein product [Ciceribacter sp. T2.26MG-112.2]|nr:unnamed protein product [Ciceribacter naphthalenivorans]